MHAVIGLGTNLGSREAFLEAAEGLIDAHDDVAVIARASLYLTPPLGPPQPDYLNSALRVETRLAPRALLGVLHGVERSLGRLRRERWGPRTIDLDVLWVDTGAITEPDLTVPHPGLVERAFALAPLLDVAPELGPRFGPHLDALGRPPQRARARVAVTGERVRVEALDDADALALAMNATPGAWTGPIEALEVPSPAELVEGAGLARVVVESGVAGPIRALGQPSNSAPRRRLVGLSGGTCVISLDPSPKLL